jgi:hypothetical protein
MLPANDVFSSPGLYQCDAKFLRYKLLLRQSVTYRRLDTETKNACLSCAWRSWEQDKILLLSLKNFFFEKERKRLTLNALCCLSFFPYVLAAFSPR